MNPHTTNKIKRKKHVENPISQQYDCLIPFCFGDAITFMY